MKIEINAVEGFKDNRADRFFDIYPHLDGQVTISIVEPNQFSGWHCHELQYDIFFVASGELKISIISPSGQVQEVFLNDNNRVSVKIPPKYWHSYKSNDSNATLIYYLSRKHDESDELRASEEEIELKFNYKI